MSKTRDLELRLDQAPLDEIREGIVKVLAREGHYASVWLPDAVAREIGASYNWAGDQRVLRQANKLAEAGIIRKVRRGERGPDGRRPTPASSAFYWSAQAWDDALIKRAARQAETFQLGRRWNAVMDASAARGYPMVKPGTLSLNQWERMLGIITGEEAGDEEDGH